MGLRFYQTIPSPIVVKSLPGNLRQQGEDREEDELTLSVIPETAGSVQNTSTMSQAPSFHNSDHNDGNSILGGFTPVRPIAKSKCCRIRSIRPVSGL